MCRRGWGSLGGSAGRKGTPNKTFIGFVDSEPGASTRHSHFQTSYSLFTSGKGGCCWNWPPPLRGAAGSKLRPALFSSAGRSPSSAAASRPRGPRSWRWWCLSLSFLQPCPPRLSSTGMQSVQLGLWVRSGSLVIDRFLLRSLFAFGISIFIEYF